MAKTKTRARKAPQARRAPPQPAKAKSARRIPVWAYALGVAALAVTLAYGAFLLGTDKAERGSEDPVAATGGLPDTPDYHSLLVTPRDPNRILLGTHIGLYESTDGGRGWTKVGLDGQDAMNLAQVSSQTLWTAGHSVFAKSTDGGQSWSDVRPDGLPSLDIHGFAVDPRDQTLWAAVAGQGLYRSTDGGSTFELVSRQVGGAVMALAVMRDGRLLAGDMQQGLLVSENQGKDWRLAVRVSVMGLAISPADPSRIIAAGPGILTSTDGGRSWKTALELPDGAGPVAWAPSDPKTAYVVGFDRTLYRSSDAGISWIPVA